MAITKKSSGVGAVRTISSGGGAAGGSAPDRLCGGVPARTQGILCVAANAELLRMELDGEAERTATASMR
jgi:hypothetical protein